jgi:hypothetical protein
MKKTRGRKSRETIPLSSVVFLLLLALKIVIIIYTPHNWARDGSEMFCLSRIRCKGFNSQLVFYFDSELKTSDRFVGLISLMSKCGFNNEERQSRA